MICKGKSIANTGACIQYGWDHEKGAEVVHSQHLAGTDPKEITAEFQLVQEENTRCQRNTLSFILSPTLEDGKNFRRHNWGN